MKISELIKELGTWPESEVIVAPKVYDPPDSTEVYTIVGVTGAAGSHVSGSDSCVIIEIDTREQPIMLQK